MDRYLARTKGEGGSHSDEEVDESLYVDERGIKIERSGGKEEVVKASESISNIKNRFGGGNTDWKKTNSLAENEVDKDTIKSARNMFKEGELRKPDSPSLNRPSKKVRDPKQIMEMRKQVTYANEEELPQDNVIHKSTVVEGVDASTKHRALDLYKNLESKQKENELSVHKPRNKLVSDGEVQAAMEGKRSMSSSASETSDANDTGIDLTVDTASGYGSAAPCSPSSTYSEEYLSDHNTLPTEVELKGDPIPQQAVSDEL